MDENKIIEIHKLANEMANKEYREHSISMYDVTCVIRAIEELTKQIYKKKS